MSTRRGGVAADVLLALAAATTTWVATWGWAGFTEVPGHFLGPLFLLAAVVAATGVLARWWRLPAPLVIAIQVVVSGMVASMMLSGSPIPLGSAWGRLTDGVSGAVASAQEFHAPVPADAAGVHPLLIPSGLVCLLLVDALACTLRRVPLAGLPLLTIYSVPVSLVGAAVSWWVFALTAAGFLCMLFLQESEQVARWGRVLARPVEGSPGSSPSAVRTSAGTIGSIATALAIVVPLMVPTLSLHLLNGGPGSGGGSDINIHNPIVDLRRDLTQGDDIPLVRVTTDDPNPDYLRISVLNRFSDNEWSSGDRDVPEENLANGDMPELVGVSSTVPRTDYHYDVSVTQDFSSTWLPTEAPIRRITADGDWRYDPSTMDFIAGDEGLTTAGMSYSMTGVALDLSAVDMAESPSAAGLGLVSADYLKLPKLPSIVRTLATDVTRDAPTRFEKAVALQNWFSTNGGFTYSLLAAPGNGVDDLVAFLSTDQGGRTGYCEQFASAMAVMARTLGIPARVAVGFLEPDNVGNNTWEFSTRDLHAWPELFFPGSGWVRFEPTPAGAGTTVPSYTTQKVPVGNPTEQPSAPTASSRVPERGQSLSAKPTESAAAGGRSDSGPRFPWLAVAGGAGVLVVLAGLGLLPRALRRTRRERRLAGGPEEAWAELRATAIDLGVPWPEGRSPRETRRRLARYLGTPVDRHTPERPRHGVDVAPEGVEALDRIVRTLELSRYAREAGPADSLREDTETCLAALHGGASRSARRRAEWWPRSVVVRRHRRRTAATVAPVQARYGGVVDHVG